MRHTRKSLQTFLQLFAIMACIGFSLPLSAAESDYRLGPGDLLKIGVFDHPELAADVRVSQSGNITFPLLGQLSINGMSTWDVEKELALRLASGGFVRQAQVSVLVMEYESQKIAVMGQVAKPGQYSLTASNKVLDALALAGGISNDTAGDHATILHSDGTKTTIDLGALMEGDSTQNLVVNAGDTLNIPRASQFYIYGEVQKPGVYKLDRNMTVSRAISTGGGLTVRGSERRTIVKRRDASGKEKEYSAKGTDVLQADDVILVRESWF